MPRRNELEEQLDAALDDRARAVADELVPLLKAAGALRAALPEVELDAAVTRRHVGQALAGRDAPVGGQVLAGPGVAGTAAGTAAGGVAGRRAGGRAGSRASRTSRASRAAVGARRWGRRVASLAVAAAVVLVPLVLASGGALPGQPLYGVKQTVENARLVAARVSADREAGERTRIAGTRLHELDRLVDGGDVERIPAAIAALDGAVGSAQQAVDALTGRQRAMGPGAGESPRAAALSERLGSLRLQRTAQLTSLLKRLPATTPVASRVEIEGAVERSLAEGSAR